MATAVFGFTPEAFVGCFSVLVQESLMAKHAIAFLAAYEPVSARIIPVDTGGVCAVNPASFHYKLSPKLYGFEGGK